MFGFRVVVDFATTVVIVIVVQPQIFRRHVVPEFVGMACNCNVMKTPLIAGVSTEPIAVVGKRQPRILPLVFFLVASCLVPTRESGTALRHGHENHQQETTK